MIVAYVRKTGNKAIACAEMTYQMDLPRKNWSIRCPMT